ncbi:NAD(P)/FAD-dependent oxidoreductase [Orrella sp. 11846]|uniref:NAD(P)/FAD-dependent oxidoreductase n=1 Tax=Orrella sp. 11846 TaxID=3409913 RepID=UPI003B5C1939
MSKLWDAIVIGAGPAGASCAVWLKQLGFEPLLLEAAEQPGGLLCTHSYPDIWTITNPSQTGKEMATLMLRQIEVAGVDLRCHTAVTRVQRLATGEVDQLDGFAVTTRQVESGQIHTERARFVVVASGVTARRPDEVDPHNTFEQVVFGPGEAVMHGQYDGQTVAILGGGDNAFENYLYVASKGAKQVDVFARTIRAQQQFIRQVPQERVFLGPVQYDLAQRTVNGRRYDQILVFYGWAPNVSFLADFSLARDERGFLQVDALTTQTSEPGLFAIGEVTQRMHPCVPTAMADGVIAAKAIEKCFAQMDDQ